MNRIFLIGNLTRDPELRTTPNGVPLCSFGLAVNRRRKVEGQPEVDFFNVTVWRQLGENCARYLRKGNKACVIGSLQVRTYDAQDGSKRTSLDVDASEVEFLPSSGQTGQGEYRPGMAPAAPEYQTSSTPSAYSSSEVGFTQVDEEELPF